MTNTFTNTKTETWSRTHARYVGGKVSADLRQMQQAYGEPSDARIDAYLDELTILLSGGYVKEVTYGYLRNEMWVVALRYKADMSGNLTTDDRSGRIPRHTNITGARFHSFLTYSDKWDDLSWDQRSQIEGKLPFPRTDGVAPGVENGSWQQDRSYASAGNGLHRATVGGGR